MNCFSVGSLRDKISAMRHRTPVSQRLTEAGALSHAEPTCLMSISSSSSSSFFSCSAPSAASSHYVSSPSSSSSSSSSSSASPGPTLSQDQANT